VSILTDPFFPVVAKYFDIEPYRKEKLANQLKERVRIEVLKMPPDIERQAICFTMPCVHCGAAIHPFRRRLQGERGTTGNMYYTPTCHLTVNIGCSRGKAAKEEVAAIRLHYGK
jgi:hypothetical protein